VSMRLVRVLDSNLLSQGEGSSHLQLAGLLMSWVFLLGRKHVDWVLAIQTDSIVSQGVGQDRW